MAASALATPRAAAASRGRVSTSAASAAPLVLITAAGAVLRLWSFALVAPNPFYDAAVRSMSLSWHNFLFGAYEPGAQASIDKAPADLWLQVASVKLIGFTGVATRLPEVAAGILAIPLLYDLVRRLFGRRAGLGAAAALAVLPAAILTAHSDTMDSLMMLLDVLAAWLVVAGARWRRAWPVVAAGAVMGVAFNVKLFEALIVAPALAGLMLLTVDLAARRRALAFAGSLAAFAAVSLSWIAAASLTPLGARPWPIGSTDGSIWNVVFVFNGVGRLRNPASPRALALDPPGPLRLFNQSGHGYATTVGIMLLAALVLGGVAAALAIAGRRRSSRLNRLELAGAVFFGTWLAIGAGLLSHVQRLQPRYLDAVTPAVAAVAGIGLARLVAAACATRGGTALLVAATAAVAAGGALLAHPPAWVAGIALVAVAGCGLAGAMRRTTALAVLALVAVLATPASAAVTVAREHRSDAGAPPAVDPARLGALSRFLTARQGRARYEVAASGSFGAAPVIIHDARPVLLLTSVYGQPLLDAAQLRRLVAGGQVRYLLGRSRCGAGACASVVRWAGTHSRDVSAQAGQPRGTLFHLSLKRSP